jgi:hypothetical protein
MEKTTVSQKIGLHIVDAGVNQSLAGQVASQVY